MQTLEQVKETHAEELAKIRRRDSIAAELAAMPDDLGPTYSGMWRATFKTAHPSAVAAIVRKFANRIVPMVQIRDGCLYQLPAEALPKHLQTRADTEGKNVFFELATHQGRGFGVCVNFNFYIRTISGVFVKVICDLPDNWKAGAKVKRPSYDKNGDSMGNGSAAPNDALRGLFHDYIAWSPNEKGSDARYSYTLIDDLPECRETLEILENSELATWWKR
jgi:hypothetical protein